MVRPWWTKSQKSGLEGQVFSRDLQFSIAYGSDLTYKFWFIRLKEIEG